MTEMFAFETWHKNHPEWPRTINAPTASAARYERFLDIQEAWCEVKYIDIRSRKVGAPVTDDGIIRVGEMRGVKFARAGMKVKVGDDFGVIVGSNGSANWDVRFTTGPNKGLKLNCHPRWMMTYYDENDNVILDTGRGRD